MSFARAASDHKMDFLVCLNIQVELASDYSAQVFILIPWYFVSWKYVPNNLIVWQCVPLSKILFSGKMLSHFFLAFPVFHVVQGKIHIWGRIISPTITVFLVCNLCLAFWRGRLVWHHKQQGLLPVWRRRLLPIYTLHQEGTQTHFSRATQGDTHQFQLLWHNQV